MDRLKKEKLEKFPNKTVPSLEVDHFSRYDGLEILVQWIAPFKGGEGSWRYSARNCLDES